MRFKDEMHMWYSDTEMLAGKLANKNVSEIQEILDEHDVIKLRSCERDGLNIFNRIFMMISFPFLLMLYGAKWMFTGQGGLDTWAKKSKLLQLVITWGGYK